MVFFRLFFILFFFLCTLEAKVQLHSLKMFKDLESIPSKGEGFSVRTIADGVNLVESGVLSAIRFYGDYGSEDTQENKDIPSIWKRSKTQVQKTQALKEKYRAQILLAEKTLKEVEKEIELLKRAGDAESLKGKLQERDGLEKEKNKVQQELEKFERNERWRENSLRKDIPQTWVSALVQYLFPSRALDRLTPNTRKGDSSYKLTKNPEIVGRMIGILATPDFRENKEVLAQALYDLLGKGQGYVQKRRKAKKSGEPLRRRFTASFKNIAAQGKEGDPAKAAVLAYVTAEAFFEVKNNPEKYPAHLIEDIYWALAWMASQNEGDIFKVYEGFHREINEETDSPHVVKKKTLWENFVQNASQEDTQKFIENNFYDQDKDYFRYKEEVKSAADQEGLSLISQELLQDPFLLTYVGAGSDIYDSLLPPDVGQLTAYNKKCNASYPDCGEASLWSFFNMVLWDQEERIFKPDVLKNHLAAFMEGFDAEKKQAIQTALESETFPEDTIPLVQLIWFYEHHPRFFPSQENRNLMAVILAGLKGVKYKIQDYCEITSGISNMQQVIARLLDLSLDPKNAAQSFDKICQFFSTPKKRLTWTCGGIQEIPGDTGVTITFAINGKPQFKWDFQAGHFALQSLEHRQKWQTRLENFLVWNNPVMQQSPAACFYAELKNLETYIEQGKLCNSRPLFRILVENALIHHSSEKALKILLKYGKSSDYLWIFNLIKRLNFAEPLKYVIKSGKLDLLKYLVEKGIDFHTPNSYGVIPLHYAARWGRFEMVQYLVENGADVNAHNEEIGTPLYYAVQSKNLEIVRYLVEKGVEVNAYDEDMGTPLLEAARVDCLAIVQYLVENGAVVNVGKDICTPLHYAARWNHFEMVQYLVENGADVNAREDDGYTPLIYAAQVDNLEMVRYLVEKGAVVNVQEDEGDTPLHYAARGNYLNIVQYLVENGASINVPNEKRMTPLHEAVRENNLSIVQYLVEKGAAVNAQEDDGDTPLHYAVRGNSLEMVQYLVEKGADVNAYNEKKVTPLYEAIRWNHLEMVQCLAKKGADLNVQNLSGDTPLHEAVRRNCFEMVQYLVEKRVNVNAQNFYGITPLHEAARENNLVLVQYLVENGANVKAQDRDKNTPLDEAVLVDNLAIVQYLIEKESLFEDLSSKNAMEKKIFLATDDFLSSREKGA